MAATDFSSSEPTYAVYAIKTDGTIEAEAFVGHLNRTDRTDTELGAYSIRHVASEFYPNAETKPS